MRTYAFCTLVIMYLSIGFLLKKNGYKPLLCFIPGINLYYLSVALKTNIIFIILLVLGCIFLPFRNLLFTFIYMFLPFLISYYYSHNILVAIITIFVPILGYPYMALKGYYNDKVC